LSVFGNGIQEALTDCVICFLEWSILHHYWFPSFVMESKETLIFLLMKYDDICKICCLVTKYFN